MDKDPQIELDCQSTASDRVRVTRHPHCYNIAVRDMSRQRHNMDDPRVQLTEAQARELFNWLGVQLHKGNPHG